jgi:hypothetical protein
MMPSAFIRRYHSDTPPWCELAITAGGCTTVSTIHMAKGRE